MELTELPAVSEPLPWQHGIWSRLVEQFSRNRFPHALLIAGAPGIGKAPLALALARLLLCHRPGLEYNCGNCSACEFSSKGAHGDFRWVQPAGDSRVIKIDQVRDAVDFVNWTAGFGQRKVLIFAPADTMTINAANALLKPLEEPAANTHLVLVCERLHGVPATVRSRCQLLKLPLPDEDQALIWLDALTGERARSVELLRLSEGRPLAAAAVMHAGDYEETLGRRIALQALLEGRASVPQVASALEELAVSDLLSLLAAFTEDHLRSRDRAALSTSGRRVFNYLDSLRRLQAAEAAGSNPNRQLLLSSLLIRLRGELGAAPLNATMRSSIRSRG